MPILEPKDSTVKAWKGLHLFHAAPSNCSMRVRMTLAEKDLPWESHHFNLFKKEHLNEDFFGVNPKGLVPTLVHDGTVITESDDIILYLDTEFPAPSLRPNNPDEIALMEKWVRLAASIHLKAIKTYIYDKKIRSKMAQTDEERAHYKSLQTDPALLDFHHKSSTDGFTEHDLTYAKETIDQSFEALESVLSQSPWIAGDQYSLADIAWAPLHFSLKEMTGYRFNDKPNISKWIDKIEARDSFKKGILDWWTPL